MRPCFDSLAFLSCATPLVFSAALLAGCASTPIEPSPCTIDLATRTLLCWTSSDPIPATVDDGSVFQLTVTLAAVAFDGTTRPFDATVDYITTGIDGPRLVYDAALLTGLEAGPAHDASIENALLWLRVQLLEVVGYERVEVSGEVAVDAAGHGHIEISWTDPASGRSSAGSLAAEF